MLHPELTEKNDIVLFPLTTLADHLGKFWKSKALLFSSKLPWHSPNIVGKHLDCGEASHARHLCWEKGEFYVVHCTAVDQDKETKTKKEGVSKMIVTKLMDFEASAPVGSMTRCEQDDGDETGGVEKSAPV